MKFEEWKLQNLPQNSRFFLGKNAAPHIPDSAFIFCDAETIEIAQNFCTPTFCFSGKAEPKVEHALQIANLAKNHETIFAIGSGAINDIAKYASHQAKKPYSIFATALSMNGYASRNASLFHKNVKKSFTAHEPRNIYLDLSVLSKAPRRLTKSGFADSAARMTAQTDMYLSHLMQNTRYEESLFSITKKSEDYIFAHFKELNAPEISEEFLLNLAENLLLSGLAMNLYGSSFPASGGEHAMAHMAELLYPQVSQLLHGEQIAFFTLEMIKVQRQFSKYKNFHRTEDLEKIFKELNLPTSPKELGLSDEELLNIKKNAHMVRERFGFLNLLQG